MTMLGRSRSTPPTTASAPSEVVRASSSDDAAAGYALEITDLSITLPAGRGARPIIDRVSLTVRRGETVGLVGESGSGKSVTSRSVLGMVPRGATVTGRVLVDGTDVYAQDKRGLRRLRATKAAMIFQDPRSGINPVRRIGDFLSEALRERGVSKDDARGRSLALLEAVGIQDTQRVIDLHPHQLSGGMLQRVMIASTLAVEPMLLLADEPTTALDVTTQAEVIAILEARRADFDAAMLFVTHNLELASAICDRIYVMYAGRIVESQTAADLFDNPQHPYTRALLAATPQLHQRRSVAAIAGRPLSLAEAPTGCSFAPRCPHRIDECTTGEPPLVAAGSGEAACVRVGQL